MSTNGKESDFSRRPISGSAKPSAPGVTNLNFRKRFLFPLFAHVHYHRFPVSFNLSQFASASASKPGLASRE
jgi:hypothetical protein